jgi:hypothetical protein
MPTTLSGEHRRFLIVDELVGPAIVNFWLNAGIAWFFFHKVSSVPLWGAQSIAIDTLVTAFLLPIFTALVAAVLVRRQVVRGKLPRIAPGAIRSTAWSRRSSFVRGALLGVAAMLVVATPVVLGFAVVGPARLSTTSFIWFKASFAAGVGVLVTPLLGWWALADASRGAKE